MSHHLTKLLCSVEVRASSDASLKILDNLLKSYIPELFLKSPSIRDDLTFILQEENAECLLQEYLDSLSLAGTFNMDELYDLLLGIHYIYIDDKLNSIYEVENVLNASKDQTSFFLENYYQANQAVCKINVVKSSK
ncbi:MAG: hypothetical protein AAFO07_00065 [Bacteroidota bacterium]